MRHQVSMSRRQFVAAAGTVTAGALLAACQPTTTGTPTVVPGAAPTTGAGPQAPSTATGQPTAPVSESRYKEAPALAERVTSGGLPPVEERLPSNPVVTEPIESVGVYGGAWKIFLDSVNRLIDIGQYTDVGVIKWNREQNGSIPFLAESWEVKEDGKQYTLNLRKGLKWSDGEPFTADDIMFWWTDVVGNSDLTPVVPYWMVSPERQVGTIESLDATTLVFRFADPYGMFITLFTKENVAYLPKHYLNQFHPNYVAKEELEKMAQAEQFANWVALFQNRSGTDTSGMSNPDMPTMYPWAPTTKPPAERFVFDRNPYFVAVDSEGNQLPYMDQVDSRVVTAEMINMKITAGEPNFQVSRQQAFKDLPLYMQYAEENEYEVYQWGDLQISECAIWPNQNAPDPVDRQIFRDRRFRIALSVAIDRDRINNTLYSGMGRPTAATLPPVESKVYKEEYAKAYTQHDPDMANSLLDEMGLDKRDADGFRLKPDGSRATFVIEVPSERLGMIDNLNMIKDDYLAVGIELIVKPEANALWGQRASAGEFQMLGWPMGKPATDTGLVPENNSCRWAPLWGLWFNTGGKQGEEPIEEVKVLQQAWSTILRTVDEAERLAAYETILTSQAENVWGIGVVGPVPKPIIKKKWMHNVKKDGVWSFHHGHFIGCTEVFQVYIEQDKQ